MCINAVKPEALPVASVSAVTSPNDVHLNNVLLLIQEIPTEDGHVTTFFDNGSTMSLVSQSYVRKKKLKGIKVSYDLVTVGGKVSSHHTYFHYIPLIDTDGTRHVIQAFEINDICGEMKSFDVDSVVNLFENLSVDDVRRRPGNIELLVGMKHAKLHPIQISISDSLILYSSKFGTGRILGGSHHLIKESDDIGKTALIIAHSQIRNPRVMFNRHLDCGIDFFSSEDFGVKLLPKCDRCKNCRNCTYEIHQISKAEQRELSIIENNLTLDPVEQRWTTRYPYKCDPSILENNRAQVQGLLIRTENRLSRSEDTCKKYKEQFQDFIDRGVFRQLDEKEMEDYQGPSFYVAHHEVYKEDSVSTPVRLVINSSLQFKGKSLNDILMKGPNTLNDLEYNSGSGHITLR